MALTMRFGGFLIFFLVMSTSPVSGNDQIVQSNNDLAWEVYRGLAKSGENVVFSPINLYANLVSLYAGSRSETRDEIREGIHYEERFSEPMANALFLGYELDRCLSNLNGTIRKNGFMFRNSASAWIHEDFVLDGEYVAFLEATSGTDIETVDLTAHRDTIRSAIYDWAKRAHCRQGIDVRGMSLSGAWTRMLLVNVIDFRGVWALPFEANDTVPGEFHCSDTSTCTVQMMHKKEVYRIAYLDDMNVLELRYSGPAMDSGGPGKLDKVAMYCLVPNEGHTLDEIEAALSAEMVNECISRLEFRTADVFVPKFKIRQSNAFRGILTSMGIKNAFDDLNADLSGITGDPKLYLAELQQNTFVEIDEKGSIARATGVAKFDLLGSAKRDEIVLDRPFVFFISHQNSGLILFAGRVIDPS